MPVRRIAATLIACATVVAAADDLGADYTWADLQAGRDINEGIYNKLSGGEFDEWRLGFTLAPAVDRIQLKGEINGNAYPGPGGVETDRVFNSPALAPGLELVWVLGDFDYADHGWYYGLGLNYQKHTYRILYAIGTESPPLIVRQYGLSLEAGYMWYLNHAWRIEFAPRVAGGMLFNQFDAVDMNSGTAELNRAPGVWIEGGARAALAWHPAGTQAWHVGLSADYRTGYGQVYLKDEGTLGIARTEARLWWFGFGYSLYYGHRF